MRFIRESKRARFFTSLSITVFVIFMLVSGSVVTAEAGKGTATKVTIIADGTEWEYVTCQKSIKSVLNESGVTLNSKDIVYPSLASKLSSGMKIRVVRVVKQIVVKNVDIPFKTKTRFDPKSSSQEKTVISKGVPGQRQTKSLVTFKDGKMSSSKVLSSKVVKNPVHEVVSVSRSAFLTSRSGMRIASIRMVATAYDPGPASCGKWASGRTANGMQAGYGVVAVDPRIIRLGTRLYVEGYGFCIAGDTGGAIRGNRIDLGFDTYSEAKRFGRRSVNVYILD